MTTTLNVSQTTRVYVDTSVFGGVFDAEFQTASRAFFQQVTEGRFQLVISSVVQREIDEAPARVREFFGELAGLADFINSTAEALQLRQAYLNAGIVTAKSAADALHVALATVAKCRLIVSWNFRHLVHFQKIPLYQGVNLVNGYEVIHIYSPPQVLNYEG